MEEPERGGIWRPGSWDRLERTLAADWLAASGRNAATRKTDGNSDGDREKEEKEGRIKGLESRSASESWEERAADRSAALPPSQAASCPLTAHLAARRSPGLSLARRAQGEKSSVLENERVAKEEQRA